VIPGQSRDVREALAGVQAEQDQAFPCSVRNGNNPLNFGSCERSARLLGTFADSFDKLSGIFPNVAVTLQQILPVLSSEPSRQRICVLSPLGAFRGRARRDFPGLSEEQVYVVQPAQLFCNFEGFFAIRLSRGSSALLTVEVSETREPIFASRFTGQTDMLVTVVVTSTKIHQLPRIHRILYLSPFATCAEIHGRD
jgi:hypothetical protein